MKEIIFPMLTDESKNKFYLSCGKRIFDLTFAVLVLIVVSPILVIIALLVRTQLGSPVLFRQMRPGLQGKPFAILKFRTMTDELDKAGKQLPDAERLTRLGAFLRKTSMDELPELINVLKGEVSIVGPRPLFTEYLPYYTDRERLRHTVRPGITGLSQVSGRNYLQWDERLEMDVIYVEETSFFLDMKIIFRTFFQVLKAKDVAVLPEKVGILFSEYRRRQKENN
jgi:lipopolysaccharide/colanic/teichoic acid biosynthesis glycosyltransferase